jgi:CRP-like cAMP-binding protein
MTALELRDAATQERERWATGPARGGAIRRYGRDTTIGLERDAVLEVREGVVALSVIHPDGTEVLLGLYGPGQILIGHPEDSCFLHLIAHTEVTATVRPWAEAARGAAFPEQLLARLRAMEAWSAMQARQGVEQRVLGVLSLLAEQFGVRRGAWTTIEIRITHAQLAAAVGAGRTTVTRILGDLRARGLLASTGAGAGERFQVREWGRANHGLR